MAGFHVLSDEDDDGQSMKMGKYGGKIASQTRDRKRKLNFGGGWVEAINKKVLWKLAKREMR